MQTITKSAIQAILRPRVAASHKGTYGHALLIAGNQGRMGAAVIAAKACLRSGVGLLTVDVPAAERFILQTTVVEAMLVVREQRGYDLQRFSAAGVGPGLGTDQDAVELLTHVLREFHQPMLLDADALNILSAHPGLLAKIRPGAILTPHPIEFDRLFGPHKDTEARIATAVRKAVEHQIVLVLKGHETLVTSAGAAFLNTTGNAGLAKGGSGDALTGMITAFLAQGYAPFAAAKLGVYLHGRAADLALQTQSMESMLITDVIGCLGAAFKEIY